MSVQFGRWNFEGEQPNPSYIERVSAVLAPYGPDSNGAYSNDGLKIIYRAFQTTKESHYEKQPHISPSGAVITWDGCLGNRTDIISELSNTLAIDSTDVAIVAAAYEEWGAGCFAKLIGDWALSIWNPLDRTLILAKDPIGTRHLYYSIDQDHVSWSTIIDTLVRFAGKAFAINQEYMAGCFAMTFPAVYLTPYVGIHAVPPSSSVFIRPGKHIVSKYWDFDPGERIRYRTDGEYEEHFRSVFSNAIQRTLRCDKPILAELSGGRDSTSIVCVADAIIARGDAETPRLDTISYYDDSEPNWNDRPYFTKVEEKRGRAGWHIDVGVQDPEINPKPELSQSPYGRFVPTPGYDGRTESQINMCLASQGNRVMLSGTGGDEVMGGVPTPTPELQDLLAKTRFGMLAHQLKAWALQQRKPWFHLFLEAVRGFFPPAFVGVPKNMRPVPWLQFKFAKRHWAALTGYPSRVKVFGPPPSFQDNMSTLDGLRRQLACKSLSFEPPYEKRYPFLDRSLLEFMYAIPREQSVRPTHRRSLMRRALVGIVPDEILHRKRKAFVARAPLVAIARDWANLVEMTEHMVSSSVGIVDSEPFLTALQKARCGEELSPLRVTRTIYIEGWLRHLLTLGIANLNDTAKPQLAQQASIRG